MLIGIDSDLLKDSRHASNEESLTDIAFCFCLLL